MSNRRAPGEDTTHLRSAPPRSPAMLLEPARAPTAPARHRAVREPRPPRPMLAFLDGLLTLLLLAGLLAGGLGGYLMDRFAERGPLAQSRLVSIPKGDGVQEVAGRLERDGVIADRRTFIAGYAWAKIEAWGQSGKPVQIKAGEYEMKPGASIAQIIDILSEGRTILLKITIPEGLTSHQIVERLKADPNLTGEIAAVPAEGALLPETYTVQRGSLRQTVLDLMQAEHRKYLEKVWADRQTGLPFKSIEEAVILASIVEKETGRNDERDRVAAVFVNRLRKPMRLQSDPTILYGIFLGKAAWGRPIYKSEIEQKTAHNTYQIDGLPPTPICNPGRAAIEATLKPAQTKDLYFVADGKGGHVFAENLKDHNANVAKWRQVEKETQAKAAASSPATRAVVRPAPSPEPTAAPAAVEPPPATKQKR